MLVRPAFAIALDCAATRAGDNAWADRPGPPDRLADVLVQRRRIAAVHALSELAVVRAGHKLTRGRPDEAADHPAVAETHA